jgi:hypothetical protein
MVQAARHVPAPQTRPSAHSESAMQSSQSLAAPQKPLAQAESALQPGRHVMDPGSQYSEVGQLSVTPGRHATHAPEPMSQRGSGAAQ